MRIANLQFYNINTGKNFRHNSAPKFTSLQQDTFVKSEQTSKYKFNGRQYYIEYPLDKDNSYTLFYDCNIERDSKDKEKMPYPPNAVAFKKPVDISKAGDVCNRHYNNCEMDSPYNPEQFNILKKFAADNKQFQKEKIVSIIDVFANTIVMELENNRVLKMVKDNPFPNRQFEPEFDIPLLSDVYKFDDYYIFIQEKADTNDIETEDVEDVAARIKQKGYDTYDIDGITGDMQIGWSPSLKKMMLIDSECAVGKTT
jgi:hypothetical protein